MSGSGWIKRRHLSAHCPSLKATSNTARGHRHRGSALRGASQDDGFVATTITPAP